jgi:hypothetical protein
VFGQGNDKDLRFAIQSIIIRLLSDINFPIHFPSIVFTDLVFS